MRNLFLVGDSILDNGAYAAPGPDTASLLATALGAEWSVELLACDGATMADIDFQRDSLPPDADTAVLSIGGNDAIEHIGILDRPARNSAAVLSELADIAEGFGDRYGRVLGDLRPRVRRLIVCTIYEPPLADPTMARLSRVPLTLLNDQIMRRAAEEGGEVLDLRAVCTEDGDFVQEIEPSAAGACKIAAAIEALVRGQPLT